MREQSTTMKYKGCTVQLQHIGWLWWRRYGFVISPPRGVPVSPVKSAINYRSRATATEVALATIDRLRQKEKASLDYLERVLDALAEGDEEDEKHGDENV